MTVPAETTTAPNLEDLPLEDKSSRSVPAYQHFTDEDLPPLRMNATRVQERLSSSTSALNIPSNLNLMAKRRRSLELTKPRSRSRSPSLTREDGSSSMSSLEDFDSDILTDRMGLEELSADNNSSINNSSSLHVSVSSLPPVNERLSEDTLEDVHAFSDVPRGGSSRGGSSRGGSIATNDVGSFQLETLDECEDEGGDDLDNVPKFHISNMEKVEEEDDDNVPEGGESMAPNLEELPLESKSSPHIMNHPYFTDEDLPPLRMNATRVQERLSSSTSALGAPSNLLAMTNMRRRSLELTKPRTRSRSPSLTRLDDGSSLSSLDDLDSDILTDRMGLEELSDTNSHCSSSGNNNNNVMVSSLPPVNERLSKDTQEDVHAFSDVPRGGASIATNDVGSVQLETLDECEDEEDLDGGTATGVHISNMENLTIEEEEADETLSVPTDAADASLSTRVL